MGHDFRPQIAPSRIDAYAHVVRPHVGVRDVREAVARDLLTSRRKKQLESMYARLLERYDVVIDTPEASPGTEKAGGTAAAGGR